MGFVFVSYAHEDHAFVGQLVQALTGHRIHVWVDRYQLMPGDNWVDKTLQAQADADVLLVIISPHSVQSQWVASEIQEAIRQVRSGNQRIIPIVTGGSLRTLRLPEHLVWIDFSDDFDQAVRQLVTRLPVSVREPPRESSPEPTTLKAKGYFFLSFVEEDSGFVTGLRQFMRDHGFGYWDFQESERDYGLQFWREIEDRIDQTAAVLSIVSPDWLLSKWTPREYLYAEEVHIPCVQLRVRPMRPSLLTVGMTYIDFTTNVQKGYDKLASELRRKKLL